MRQSDVNQLILLTEVRDVGPRSFFPVHTSLRQDADR